MTSPWLQHPNSMVWRLREDGTSLRAHPHAESPVPTPCSHGFLVTRVSGDDAGGTAISAADADAAAVADADGDAAVLGTTTTAASATASATNSAPDSGQTISSGELRKERKTTTPARPEETGACRTAPVQTASSFGVGRSLNSQQRASTTTTKKRRNKDKGTRCLGSLSLAVSKPNWMPGRRPQPLLTH